MNIETLNHAFKRIYDPPKRGWHSKKKRQFKKSHKKYIDLNALLNAPSLLLKHFSKYEGHGERYYAPVILGAEHGIHFND